MAQFYVVRGSGLTVEISGVEGAGVHGLVLGLELRGSGSNRLSGFGFTISTSRVLHSGLGYVEVLDWHSRDCVRKLISHVPICPQTHPPPSPGP